MTPIEHPDILLPSACPGVLIVGQTDSWPAFGQGFLLIAGFPDAGRFRRSAMGKIAGAAQFGGLLS